MSPTYQRFGAGNLSGPQIDFRLVVQHEFLAFQTVGLDSAKVGVLEDNGKEATRALKLLQSDPNATKESIENQQKLVAWWEEARKTAAGAMSDTARTNRSAR